MSSTTLGVNAQEQRRVDFLNQQVGPFCDACNRVFIGDIEDGVADAIDRLFTTDTLEIPARDIEPLRRWVYMTSIVRSLLDRATDRAVPPEWFRDFYASGGTVPSNTAVIIARVTSPASIHSSRVTHRIDGLRPVVIQECSLMIGQVLLIVTTWGRASASISEEVRLPSEAIVDNYEGRFAFLDGTEPIRLRHPLRWQDVPSLVPPSNLILRTGKAWVGHPHDVDEAESNVRDVIVRAHRAMGFHP